MERCQSQPPTPNATDPASERLQYSQRWLDRPRILTISSLPDALDKYKLSGGSLLGDARCTQCIRCRFLGYLDISRTSPSPGINRKAFIEPSFPNLVSFLGDFYSPASMRFGIPPFVDESAALAPSRTFHLPYLVGYRWISTSVSSVSIYIALLDRWTGSSAS
ncbi:hypothetical protein BDN71DRAFT_1304531 [Pleurotus eryngii]|uniref:Uncharacterized protein n=1 Tax=Pleurotus eryngii TaxID=5323 RepID=A0A9P5ZNH8_PLEER|nr:hypothetical protein BDN71DRAFT_1304531 [Pleurotus eryngii]